MTSPFFSIIIPLYNKERHIKNTLDFVLGQAFQNYEVLIIDDGSTDQSVAQVKSIDDERIKLFTTKNNGVSSARNYGIAKAQGHCIAFIDADDEWLPNHLEKLKDLYDEYPQCGLYAMAYKKRINSVLVNSEYSNLPAGSKWRGIVPNYFEASLLNCIAWTSALMIPKSVFGEIGTFDERITFGAGEDTDLWMRIALKYPVAFDKSVTAIHNMDADNRLSNANTNKRRFIDLDIYEVEAQNRPYLKKYLDINRFSIGLQYKAAGNSEKAITYFNRIDKSNLNFKQRLLIRCKPSLLFALKRFQNSLRSLNIHLSAFK